MEKENPLVLPSVSSSIEQVINEQHFKTREVFSSDVGGWTLDKTSLDNDATNVIIFHLEPVHGIITEERKNIFKRNDKTMGDILMAMRAELKRFGVIFTSQEPSQVRHLYKGQLEIFFFFSKIKLNCKLSSNERT